MLLFDVTELFTGVVLFFMPDELFVVEFADVIEVFVLDEVVVIVELLVFVLFYNFKFTDKKLLKF